VDFRRGNRVRVKLNSSYRHFLDGLEGNITLVLHHAVVVALDNPPGRIQKIVEPGLVGPKIPNPQQHMFQFHEVEVIT